MDFHKDSDFQPVGASHRIFMSESPKKDKKDKKEKTQAEKDLKNIGKFFKGL